jgi:hypothetical protein
MNKERMLLLADLLEGLPEHKFSIEYWASEWNDEHQEHVNQDDGYIYLSGYDCTTAGCVAGWAMAMKNDMAIKNDLEMDAGDIEHGAAAYLGLNRFQANDLFYYGSDSVYARYAGELGLNTDQLLGHQITQKHASIVVRKVAEGEWSLV